MLNYKLICMLLAALFSVLLPVVLLIVWKKTTRAKLLPFFIGMLVFLVFAVVLEQLLFLPLVQRNPLIAEFLTTNVIGSAIFYAVTAGIFEETGRYLAFKTVLRKRVGKETGVTYGIGHGGMEMLLLLGQTYVLLLLSLLMKDNTFFSPFLPTAENLTVGFIGCAVLERIFALALHVSLSVFVFTAARNAKKLWLYPVAIWLHAMADIPATLYQARILPLWQAELYIGVFAVVVLFLAIRLYKKTGDAPAEQPAE